MRRLIFILLFLPFLLSAQSTFYLATDGDDGDVGSLAEPWATLKYAIIQLDAGDTLNIRGGRYYSYFEIEIDPESGQGNTGTAANKITVRGYPSDVLAGNKPIIDCQYRIDSLPDPGWNIYNEGIYFAHVEHWVLKDFDIRNVQQIDPVLTGGITGNWVANFTFENIALDSIGHRGYWWRGGAWSYADSARSVDIYGKSPSTATPYWDSDSTYWINCDVSNCFDSLSSQPGNGADAWKCIFYWGNYVELNGCRAWYYGDDGYDLNGGAKFYDCWAYSSDTWNDYSEVWDIEGNGFKLTQYNFELLPFYTYQDSIDCVNDSNNRMYNCLAMYCVGQGMNIGPESDTSWNDRIYNTTLYHNDINILSQFSSRDTIGHIFKNVISYAAQDSNAIGQPSNILLAYTPFVALNSTFEDDYLQYGYAVNTNYTLSDTTFVTLDSLYLDSLFTKARAYNGELDRTTVPLMLRSTSNLIDGGIDVGLPYNSTVPDLGYHEYDAAPASSPPVANFVGDSLNILEGQHVDFTDLSTNTPTSWSWTLPGGTPSSISTQNPTIQYNTAGTYTVTLQATNADGSDSEIKTNYITVSNPLPGAPVANFSVSDQTIDMGDAVNFTDLSTNTPTSWAWVFDGGTPSSSSLENPIGITYSTPGTYTVSLTATNAGGPDDEVKIDFIAVADTNLAPVADFSSHDLFVYLGEAADFTDLSTNTPTSWAWVFEGGTPEISTVGNPTVYYNTVGLYTVTLTATNGGGSDGETKTNYIMVIDPSVYKVSIEVK